VFENRVLRKYVYVFVTEREEITGGWRKLHIEGLRDLYCSPNIIRLVKLRRT
jgi:hypothetical protein